MTIRCRARVQITVEVDSGSCWGGGASLDQVHQQATEGALDRLRRALQPTDVRIVGEPKVTAIMTEEAK
jgi:hypothetical protein